MENLAKIFSTTLDMYLTYQMVSFLNGETERENSRKSLFRGIWLVLVAVCLCFLIDRKFYGIVYFGSLAILLVVVKKQHLFRCFLYMIGCALIVGMTNLAITCGLSFAFFEEIYLFDIPVLELAAGLMCFLIYSFLLLAGKKYLSRIESSLSNSLLIFSLLMLGANSYILLYAIHFTERIQDIAEKREISMVFSMVSLGMLVELLLVILSVSGVYSYRKMISYKDELIKAQVKYAEYIKQSNYALQKVKHDCKAHYGVISYLLEKERYQEVKNYTKELTDSIQDIAVCCDTGSPIVDALVSEKMVFAQENEVAFSFRGRLPETCRILDTDQCILFSNILNNAFEAVLKVEAQKRKVDISIRVYEEELLIRASNTYTGELIYEDGKLTTSKNDKGEHGFGLKNIDEIMKKYGCNMDVIEDNGMFVVLVRV